MQFIIKNSNEKFKSIYLSYNFTFEINKQDISSKILLALILSKSSSKFKTNKDIENYLSNLYGTNFDVNFEKIGNYFNIEFRLEFLNKNFVPDKSDLFEKVVDFLYEIIYNPNLNNNLFDENIFNLEKAYIIDKINKRKDEKLRYAVLRTEEILFEEEPFGIYLYGDLENTNNIEYNSMYNVYKDFVNNSLNSIVITGNLDGYENIENLLKEKFKSNTVDFEVKFENNLSKKTIKELKEETQTTQAVITIGLRVLNASKNDFYALSIYNTILGVTPASKLFQEVREKRSLAYTSRSKYYRYNDAIIIYAGIEHNNYELTKEVIFEQLNEMNVGNITDLELSSAKDAIIADLNEMYDSKISIAKLEFTNNIKEDNLSVENMIESINNITKEDIIAISKKINVELVYLLHGENND